MGTVEIPLTQGKVAIVDVQDFRLVQSYEWRTQVSGDGRCYAQTGSGDRAIWMHRLILNPAEHQFVDHRDCDGLNNSRANLRLCSPQQNMMNRRKIAPATSTFKGVRKISRPRPKPWYAEICIDYRKVHIGSFETEIEAAHAYDVKARELFGEFARTNF